jgi:nuclear transport factor 2 (NTF2) superfamily protein
MTLSPIAIADIRSATGKPLLDFYTVYGAIDSVRIINELCNTKFPEYKNQNDRAYSLWRSRNKEFIYKIEQYNHAIVTKTSKGNDASYRRQMLETAQTYERNKVAMHQMFSDYGETTYRSMCSAYREYTESEKADFPNYNKEHMLVFESYLRKKQ